MQAYPSILHFHLLLPWELEGLPAIVDRRFVPFANWVGHTRKMGVDFVELKHLREKCKRHDTNANCRLSNITKFASFAAGGFLRQAGIGEVRIQHLII